MSVVPSENSFERLSVETDRADRTAIIRVNRPAARNAIDRKTMDELEEAIQLLETRTELGCVVLTGEGDRAFIAGGDLKDFSQLDTPAMGQEMARRMQLLLNRWEALPIPTIAAIGANAYGGGCEIALACDLRVMAEGAHLVFSQARLGLLTGWGGTARLVRAVGVSASMQILMTGQYLTALRAKELGLVAEVAPDGYALAGALDLARQITRHPREAIEALKAVILAASTEPFDRALEVENQWFGKRWCSPEHRRAVSAFLGQHPAGTTEEKS